jgi:hypothetical protein
MDVGVANDLHGSFARISAIRDRQTQTRIARSEQLARLVAYFRATLVEYLTRTDPITGARLVDIGVDESKAHGGFSVVLALFDGSKLKIAVDALGRYSHASVPDIFAQIGRIVEVRVLDDFTRADICYLAPGDSRGPIRIEPVDTFLLAMLSKAAESIEAQSDEPSAPAPQPLLTPVLPTVATTPSNAKAARQSLRVDIV